MIINIIIYYLICILKTIIKQSNELKPSFEMRLFKIIEK